MGLDMYLTRETYVKNWDFMAPEERNVITVAGPATVGIDPAKIKEIVEEVGYWRKANAIHLWFVANCQDGVDECQKTYVSKEQLATLLALVDQVLADHTLAPKLLPTGSGFFFGSTDYDEWYFDDLQTTRNIIAPILARTKDEEHASYYYQSSW